MDDGAGHVADPLGPNRRRGSVAVSARHRQPTRQLPDQPVQCPCDPIRPLCASPLLAEVVDRVLGRSEWRVVKIPAVLPRSAGDLRQWNPVDAPNPARQMALVGETCASGYFSQAESPVAD